jgi:hypothetical protein
MAFELGYPASWDRLIKLFVVFKLHIYVRDFEAEVQINSLLEAELACLALFGSSQILSHPA